MGEAVGNNVGNRKIRVLLAPCKRLVDFFNVNLSIP